MTYVLREWSHCSRCGSRERVLPSLASLCRTCHSSRFTPLKRSPSILASSPLSRHGTATITCRLLAELPSFLRRLPPNRSCNKIPSAHEKPSTSCRWSFQSLVFPSRATSNLISKNPACSAIHGLTERTTSIWTSHVSSIALRVVPFPAQIESLKTIPLLFELRARLFSMITLRHVHSPADFLGTTMLNHSFSSHKKMPLFSFPSRRT